VLENATKSRLTDLLKAHYKDPQHLYEDLHRLFQRDHELAECPEYFQDPITYVPPYLTQEMFKRPYLSPSGLTYERELLLDHIRTNGPVDPTTK